MMLPFPGFIPSTYQAAAGGSISFVISATGDQTGSATTTVTTPAHLAGDLLVFVLINSNNTHTLVSGPTGATLKITETAIATGLRVWCKVSSGAEPGTFSAVLNTTGNAALACLVYRGAANIDGTYAVQGTTANPSVTGTFSPSLAGVLVSLFTSELGSANTITTPPAGPVSRATVLQASRNMALYDLNPQAASLTAAQSLTWGNATGARCNLVFQVIP